MDNLQDIDKEVIAVENPPSNVPSNPPQKKSNKPMAQATVTNEQPTIDKESKKRDRKIGLLPTPTSELAEVEYKGKVVAEMTWATLPARKMFSVNSNGASPCFKISKSSYFDIMTEEVCTNVPPQSQLKVYRIRIA